jgi:uncharacterized protein with von Willebrand factor type A (vWA) domain
VNTAEALYNWGFALLHQAKTKAPEEGIALCREAIEKFSFSLLVAPTHLGAAIDGGVTFMEMARMDDADAGDVRYDQAMEFFNKAEQIQNGSASYNLACIHALRDDHDACRKALEKCREHGSLPDEQDVMNDPDMASVRNSQWFQEFLGAVKVAQVEQEENDRRTRRGLKEVDEVKLDLPPRPTDSVLKRHYDQMVQAELEKQKEMLAQKKREIEEARAKRTKKDPINYYK